MISIRKPFGNVGTFLVSAALAAALGSAAAGTAEFHGQPYGGGDVRADSWVATDGVGRVVPGFAECGPVKKDKWVGIFYWTWHTPRPGPYDNKKILAEAKGGVVHWPADGAAYHWGEPESLQVVLSSFAFKFR